MSGGFLRQDIFFEHLFFAIDQSIDVVRREFKSVAMRNRIRRTGFYAITAENAARIIDVVNGGIPLARRNPVRIRILRGFNVNAIRRASSGTQKASHALLQAVLVAVQHVNAAVARLKMHWLMRVIFRDRLAEHILEGHEKSLTHCAERREYFADRGCHRAKV